MVAAIREQESRRIRREMAAERRRLADAIRRPRSSKQMQMEEQALGTTHGGCGECCEVAGTGGALIQLRKWRLVISQVDERA